MRMLQGFAVAGWVVGALAVAPMSSAVAVTLDTPQIEVADQSPWYIAFKVTAGLTGAPQGFTVDWMTKADFDAYGWPTDYIPPGFNYCDFTGIPTFRVTPGLSSYILPPSTGARIYLGELFDETGLYTTYTDEMVPATAYAVRVRADGGPLGDESANSATLFASSSPHEDCRFTQGYWKNHPEAWPVGSTPMFLGTVSYTQAELLQILNQPANGNGLVILAHQLIAAKLNTFLAAPPPSIATAIAQADAMIGNQVVPPIGNGYLDPSQTDALVIQLDDFNNGKTQGDNCVTPTRASSWGRLKALYR